MSSNCRWLWGAVLAASSLFVCAAGAQTREQINAVLDTKVPQFEVPAPARPATEVFDALSSTYNIPIIVDPGVTGDISYRVYGTTVRGLLNAICEPKGWHYEIRGSDGSAYLAILRFITKSYSIDYPQVDQQANSSASVSLSGGDTTGGLQNGNGSAVQVFQPTNNTANGQTGMQGMGNGAGASTVSLTATSKADFWERLEAGAKRYVSPEEILDVNRFAGAATLTGSLGTHALVENYITLTMRRVRRHASITLQSYRIEFNKEHAQGIDLNALKFELGKDLAHVGGTYQSPNINGQFTASGTGTVTGAGSGDFGSIAGTSLGGPTGQLIIGAGKLSMLVTALSKRGHVEITDTSFASALNNQMALIQVTRDLPFPTRSNTTLYNPGGITTPGIPPVATTNYSWQTVSFGNVLEVTPQISDTLVTTVVVAPSVTEFLGSVNAPDGSGSRPSTGTRRYRSTYVLPNHASTIIGAFMEVTKGKTSDGVPIVERIPIVGGLFRTDRDVDAHAEFLLVMTVDAEDGDVAPPTVVEMPIADQARRLGVSPDMQSELQKAQARQGVPVAAADAANAKPSTTSAKPGVQLIGSDGK